MLKKILTILFRMNTKPPEDPPSNNTRSKKRKRKPNKITTVIKKKTKIIEELNSSTHSDTIEEETLEETIEEINDNETNDKETNDKEIPKTMVKIIDEYGDEEYFPDEEGYDYEDGFLVLDDFKSLANYLGIKVFENIQKRIEEEDEFGKESIGLYDEDLEYFNNLTDEEKNLLKEKNKEVNEYNKIEIPLKIKILKSNIPISTKATIMEKIKSFDEMTPHESGYGKMKKYLNRLSRIPFGNYVEMPIKKTDTHKKIDTFIKESYKCLDNAVYGQTETKMKIIQIMAQWISNPNSVSSVIALQGPPGVGKTSILKHGLAKALKRPFSFIALGGATDASFLEGHGFTYEGSMYGRIASILMETKCMNPIIFFDELDKISETKHGEEIVGILTHLTDSTQNSTYHDKYFEGIDLDLSKALIVFAYNDEKKINPILKDRILTINVKGFTVKEKIEIAKNYLLKEITENIGLKKEDINISDELLTHIINNFTSEQGVRDLKRCLETIVLKLNLMRYTDMSLDYRLKDITFPITLTKESTNKLLGKVKGVGDESRKRLYM